MKFVPVIIKCLALAGGCMVVPALYVSNSTRCTRIRRKGANQRSRRTTPCSVYVIDESVYAVVALKHVCFHILNIAFHDDKKDFGDRNVGNL